MGSLNNISELKKQYGTAQNLDTRILLHQLFNTN